MKYFPGGGGGGGGGGAEIIHFSYFCSGSLKEHSCEDWLKLAQWCSRSCHFKQNVGCHTLSVHNTFVHVAHYDHFILR